MDSDSCCPSATKILNIKFYKDILMSLIHLANRNSKVALSHCKKRTGEIFSILAYFKIILNQVSDKKL